MQGSLQTIWVLCAGWVLATAALHHRGSLLSDTTKKALVYAPALGFGSVSLWWFGSLAVGWAPPAGFTYAIVVLCGAGMLYATSRRYPPAAQPTPPALPSPRRSTVQRVGTIALLLGLSHGIWCILVNNASAPDGAGDGLAIWNLLARLQFRAPSDYLDQLSLLVTHHHPDYPQHLPAALAAQWHLAGGETPLVNQLTHMSLYLGLVLATHRGLVALGARELAPYGAAVVATTSTVVVFAQQQYSDVCLAYLFVIAGISLATRFGDSNRSDTPPVLAGFVLGLLPWTKNEGAPLALLLLGLWGLHALREPGRGSLRRDLVPILGGAALPVLALVLFKSQWAPPNSLVRDLQGRFFEFVTDLDRWGIVASTHFSDPRWLAMSVLLCVGLTRREVRSDPRRLYLGVLLLAAMLSWFMVYVLTPQSQTWHLETSRPRLLLQLFPLLVVFAIAVFGKSSESPGERLVPQDAATTLPRR